jgi:hypothetical protein
VRHTYDTVEYRVTGLLKLTFSEILIVRVFAFVCLDFIAAMLLFLFGLMVTGEFCESIE